MTKTDIKAQLARALEAVMLAENRVDAGAWNQAATAIDTARERLHLVRIDSIRRVREASRKAVR